MISTALTPERWRRLGVVGLVLAAVSASVHPSNADETNARELVKAMSDYLGAQEKLSFSFDSSVAAITGDLQKVEFASSGTVSLSRPDKIRVTRTGGFADVEMVFDGKQLSILGKNIDRYMQVEAPGTVDQLFDFLRANLGVEAPGADLLLANVDDALMEAVVDVKDLGSGVINGVECNHLAFRTRSVDWQIWITMGDEPRPCRYVVTSKLVALAPEYRVDVRDWKTGTAVAADDFGFNPGAATKGDTAELRSLDELHYPAAEGGAQ
jgi:hypothetical protein